MALQPLDYGLFRYLVVGRALHYRAGEGPHHIEANVEVATEPGITGVYVKIVEIIHTGTEVEHEVGAEVLAAPHELYVDNTFRYPKEDPGWTQATRVTKTTVANHYRVWVDEKNYGIHRATWADPLLDHRRADCLVEDEDLGWLRIWWYEKDIDIED